MVDIQACGSPCYHVIYWVKDAPSLDVDPDEVTGRFIKEYVTIRIPDDDEELNLLVITLQCHQCSAYCHRKLVSVALGFQRCHHHKP